MKPQVATLNQTSPEALCAEILADARRQTGQMVQRARQQADALLAKAAAEAEKARQLRLESARSEAARRKELVMATIPVETGRMRAARIEALLQAIYAEARQRLADRHDFEFRTMIVVLAAEAIGRMAGDAFLVKLSAADLAGPCDGLAREIALRVGRSSLSITISDELTITDSGLIVQDIEGRQVWDNRLSARLERLWPEVRRRLVVQSSFVTEDPAVDALPFTHHAPVAPKSPASPAQRGSGDDAGSTISKSPPVPATRPGERKQ